ncbi:flocculation protein FLO11-like [Cucumis melo var. makuwa]|uniref:Flocculation protein FLO11-like n=1 Tax=Cucumis melo var. makuwa TaxID=1194695 RepID=A0A5A7UGS9_CUCMM|nr:flocculation protein FLO11-like [Cucumis melo var. makuwa]
MVANVCYTSTMEPTTVTAALTDEHWILAMHEELLQFERNQFKLFQMDVKSAFLNGYLSEEVYVTQPKGFQIKQDKTRIFFSQEKYAKNIISKFGMDKAKPKRTPAATHLKLTKDATREKVDSSLYRSIIGSLLYLTASRSDIAFAVGVCACYQADPRTSHLHSIKCILKYIIGQISNDRKSTYGEYIAAGSSCSQLLWMKQMMEEYGILQSSMVLYYDNISAISIFKNPIQHSCTKHIDIRHHFIRELVEANIISLEHVRSSLQLADIFTKPLDVSTFEGLQADIKVRWNFSLQNPLLLRYINARLFIMVATRFNTHQSSVFSSIHNSSASSVSISMALSPPKTVTSSKGKRYKGIPTKHPYKKIHRSVPPTEEGQHCQVPIPVHCSHAGCSSNPGSLITVKKEVPEFSPPRTSHLSTSSSVPEPRVSIETVVLDSDSSDSKDNVVLSTLLHRKSSAAPSSPHAFPQASLPTNEDDASDETDEDYVPGTEETTVLEDSSTSTEDPSASHDARTLEPRSTEGSSEFSIPMSPPGNVDSSYSLRRPPVRGQRVFSTKAGRRKIPPNVPSVPIDGVSFRSEEGAHKWKYMVKQWIADEANMSNQYNSCPAILDVIRSVGLHRTFSAVGPFYSQLMHELIVNLPSDFNDPSAEEYQKVHIRGELTGGTVHVWPVDGQLPVASLTVKYVILHRIGISN